MIRTKSIDLPKWKKTGRGSFRMANGKIIKPNQVFSAKESEIPAGFRNLVIRMDAGVEEVPVIGIKTPAFEVQPITPAVQKILDDFNAETDAVLDEKDIDEVLATELKSVSEMYEKHIETAKSLLDPVPTAFTSEDIMVEDAGHGWYNVVNSVTGKIINEKKLRLRDAEIMRSSLI